MRQISHVVFDAHEIDRQIRRVALEIKRAGYDRLLVVALLEGGAIFAADLVRALWKQGVDLEFVHTKVSIYNEDMSDRGMIVYSWQQMPAVAGRCVLLVDDTIGTGRTFRHVAEHLITCGAKCVHLAAVINAIGKERHPEFQPTYSLFKVNEVDFFRAGYGEDVDGKLRNLPFIAAMTHE